MEKTFAQSLSRPIKYMFKDDPAFNIVDVEKSDLPWVEGLN